MTGSSALLPLPQRRWGRWRAASDGVWKAAIRRRNVCAAGLARRAVMLVAGGRRGPATTFPSILAEVCSGATSEHDAGGNDALARGARSSARRARFSQANADWALFRGFRLPCTQTHHRSRWSHARDARSENQGRPKGRMVSTGGISRSSFSRRTHHRRASDCHRAHQGGDPGSLMRQAPQARLNAGCTRPPLKARDEVRVAGPSFKQRATPHPSLRATFPSVAGEGERGTRGARR
jgi:hypothetical protein